MHRLFLVRHAPTAATRAARFSADEPLDVRGRRQARALGPILGRPTRVLAAPTLCARQTAQEAGLSAEVEEALAECDFGAWPGRTIEEVYAADPEGFRAWREDPEATPHGGESLAALIDRVAAFLERARAVEGTTVAITHGGPVKAAVMAALASPVWSFWSIDVAPASVTELHADGQGWRLVRTNWTVRSCRQWRQRGLDAAPSMAPASGRPR